MDHTTLSLLSAQFLAVFVLGGYNSEFGAVSTQLGEGAHLRPTEAQRGEQAAAAVLLLAEVT